MPNIFKGLVALVIVVGIGLYIVASNLGSIIESGINEYAPAVIGVPVSVKSVDVDLLAGKASLNQFYIANPDGFSNSNIFELNRIDIELDLQSLRGEVVVINRIGVDGATIRAEQVGRRTNLQVLQEKISKSSSNSSGATSASNDTDNAPTEPPKIAIALFEFTNANVALISDQLGNQDVDVPDITLKNIGTPKNGLTIESAAQAVLKPLMKKLMSEVQKQALDKVVEKEIDKALDKALGDDAAKYKGVLKGLFKK